MRDDRIRLALERLRQAERHLSEMQTRLLEMSEDKYFTMGDVMATSIGFGQLNAQIALIQIELAKLDE